MTRAALAAAACLWLTAAAAQVDADRSQITPAAAAEPAPPVDKFEGAVGLVATFSPSYPGASDFRWTARPAGFLRYGRWTVTGAGGFTTHRNDEVERGLATELAHRGDLRLRLGLHLDHGRSEDRSPRLAGMGTLPATLRPSLTARWQPVPHSVVTASLRMDLLNRVGGLTLDLGASRSWQVAPGRQLLLGASVSLADSTYMQAWHGVSASQSQSSGLPAYRASGGLRSAGVGLTYRHEFGPAWASYVGINHARLLGAAADSPLTLRPGNSWVSAGLAWRF